VSAFEVLALNTSIPQIQAAQAGDSYVMVVNATTPALRITQTGTGNALEVEDSANPDATPFVVSAAGDVGIGTSSPNAKLAVAGGGIRVSGYSSNSAGDGVNVQIGTTGGVNYLQSLNGVSTNNLTIDGNQILFRTGVYSDSMILNSSGNLGLGVTPSAWANPAVYRAFEIGAKGNSFYSASGETHFTTNCFFNTSGQNIYGADGFATEYQQASGQHRWYTAASGTAGNAISFTQAMTLDASGRLLVGATSASSGARATLTSAAQASGAACADSGILLYPTANLATGEYAPFITWSGNFSNPNRARAAIGAVSSSTSTALDLVFLTRSAADASEIGTGSERARITSGGNLLVGTNDASQGSGNGNKLAAGGAVWVVNAATADGFSYYNSSAAAYRFYVSSAGTISATNTTISAISDQRLKENIQDLDVGLDKILALKPRKFDWKAGKGKNIKGDRGWIAQEFEQVFPDMIDEWKDPAPEGEEPYKSVRADLIPVLVKAIQELKAEVDSLKAQLEAK